MKPEFKNKKEVLEFIDKEFPEFVKSFPNRSLAFDYIGEPLLYVIFPDFVKYYENLFDSKELKEIHRINKFLISLLAEKDFYFTDLVIIGFLEHIDPNGRNYSTIKDNLPPILMHNLKKVEDFWK